MLTWRCKSSSDPDGGKPIANGKGVRREAESEEAAGRIMAAITVNLFIWLCLREVISTEISEVSKAEAKFVEVETEQR